MGRPYFLRYDLRKDAPDGVYRFIINDIIDNELPLVNGKLEGIVKRYINGILWEETPYHVGKPSGYGRTYNLSGNHALHLLDYHHNGDRYLIIGFDPAGNVVSRRYFVNGDAYYYRAEEKEPSWNAPGFPPLTQNGVAVTGSNPRNGLYELVSPLGRYQLFFTDDNITWWKWLDKDGKLVIEVHAEPGQRL